MLQEKRIPGYPPDSMNPIKGRSLLSPRLGVMLPLGFASGLPLALTGGTLQAWLTMANVELATIGLFAYVGLPYTVKFLWAPIMDRIVPPWLGRRRGWMIVTQLGLALALTAMAVTGPTAMPHVFAAIALGVAFVSASQDIVFDAYRTDVLKPDERGLGVAIWVMGYRLAMIVSGSVALILADRIGWTSTYLCLAGVMLLGIVTILISPDPTDAPAGSAQHERGGVGAAARIFLTADGACPSQPDRAVQNRRCICRGADDPVPDARFGLFLDGCRSDSGVWTGLDYSRCFHRGDLDAASGSVSLIVRLSGCCRRYRIFLSWSSHGSERIMRPWPLPSDSKISPVVWGRRRSCRS